MWENSGSAASVEAPSRSLTTPSLKGASGMAEFKSSRIERGIRWKDDRAGIEAYVTASGSHHSRYFAADTPLDEIRKWRSITADIHKRKHSDYMPAVSAPPRADNGGYVYFAQVRQYVKIGKARDVRQRMEELQTAHPDALRLVAYFRTNFPGRCEAEIMREYAAARVRGEWFRLTPDMCRLIEKHAKASQLDGSI
jgi:hypothetical protein